jgi:beta-phosphoglucomutase
MVKVIIFDFDGVLFDTERLHFDLFRRVLRKAGVALSPEAYYVRYIGLTEPACFRAALADHGQAHLSSIVRSRKIRKGPVCDPLSSSEGLSGWSQPFR